jgi:hypothetical protein
MYKWHPLSDYHFFNRIGLDTCWSGIPFLFRRSLSDFCLPGWNNLRFFIDPSNFLSYGEHVSISAEHLGRPRPDLLFLKIGMGDISSGNIMYVDVLPAECEVEGVECEVVLWELPATSLLKAQSEAACVADCLRDSSAPAQGLCSSVAATKSKSSKIFLFNGCRP